MSCCKIGCFAPDCLLRRIGGKTEQWTRSEISLAKEAFINLENRYCFMKTLSANSLLRFHPPARRTFHVSIQLIATLTDPPDLTGGIASHQGMIGNIFCDNRPAPTKAYRARSYFRRQLCSSLPEWPLFSHGLAAPDSFCRFPHAGCKCW